MHRGKNQCRRREEATHYLIAEPIKTGEAWSAFFFLETVFQTADFPHEALYLCRSALRRTVFFIFHSIYFERKKKRTNG